jgi:hypothetical protein
MRPAGGRVELPNRPNVVGSAEFSHCGDYRYVLTKRWADGQTLVAIMLNPSTATEAVDDPTVRRVVLRAQGMEEVGSLAVLNVYAYRATNPRELREVPDPVGPENDRWIAAMVARADKVLIAWGNRGAPRASAVLSILARRDVPVYRLGSPTRRGNPRHPLYVRKDAPLEPVDLSRWRGLPLAAKR